MNNKGNIVSKVVCRYIISRIMSERIIIRANVYDNVYNKLLRFRRIKDTLIS